MSEQSLRSQISWTTFRHEMVEPERGSEGLSGSGERGRLQWRRGKPGTKALTSHHCPIGQWTVAGWMLAPGAIVRLPLVRQWLQG